MTFWEFGKALLETGDLDPVYLGLMGVQEPKTLARWLLAYCCYYHCGVASYLAQFTGSNFWEGMLTAAENREPTPLGQRWPRSAERRHFRGQTAVKSVRYLQKRYPQPERFIAYLGSGPLSFAAVSARVSEHPLFGRWIAFKIGDLLERVVKIPVDFSGGEILMYDSPEAGAEIVWAENPKHLGPLRMKDLLIEMRQQFKGYKAPPQLDRPVNMQEWETMLCKYHSFTNGHYWVGKDIAEVRHGLQPWCPYTPIAEKMLSNLPKEVQCTKRLW